MPTKGIDQYFHGSIFTNNRINQYFSNRPYLYDSYVGAANFVKSKKCSDVGLSISGDGWEYPFWVLIHSDNSKPIRIEHFNVKNISATQSGLVSNFNPCAIISLNSDKGEDIITKDHVYTIGWSISPVNVFIRKQI